MSNWTGQTRPWLAGLSAWNLIKLKSRSCWAWFFSGTWGCGGVGPGFEITWFLTEFSCLQIQDRGPFFVPDIRWESRLSLRGCPQFFAMWLPLPKAVRKMTFWFFSCARRTLFSLTFPSIPVSYKSLIWWNVTTGVIPYDHFPCIITRILTCSAAFNSLRAHRLQPTRLLCPWDSPARILEWGAISSSRGSSQPVPGIELVSPASPASAGRFFPTESREKPLPHNITSNSASTPLCSQVPCALEFPGYATVEHQEAGLILAMLEICLEQLSRIRKTRIFIHILWIRNWLKVCK